MNEFSIAMLTIVGGFNPFEKLVVQNRNRPENRVPKQSKIIPPPKVLSGILRENPRRIRNLSRVFLGRAPPENLGTSFKLETFK